MSVGAIVYARASTEELASDALTLATQHDTAADTSLGAAGGSMRWLSTGASTVRSPPMSGQLWGVL